MTTIAITGVAGGLGRRLLARLDADPSVTRVVGIDRISPSSAGPKLDFHRIDVREIAATIALATADAVVHLAFARSGSDRRSINIEGTRAVVEAVSAAGAARLVFGSTAMVYGARPDNDVPLTEVSPLRPPEEFDDMAQIIEAETLARKAGNVVVLRFAHVVGPTVDGELMRLLSSPRFLTIKGYAPPIQVVDEDDAAAALHAACGRLAPGDYNVAADGWMTVEEVLALSGKRPIEMPEAVAFSLAARAFRLGMSSAHPSELAYAMYPWVVDTGRIRAAGWTPACSNREALGRAVGARRGWVAIGRSRVRKADVAKGAAATVGLIAAVSAVRRARRRR